MKVNFSTVNVYHSNYNSRNKVSFGQYGLNKIGSEISADIGKAIKEINADSKIRTSYINGLTEDIGLSAPLHHHKRTEQICASRERVIAMLTGEDIETDGDEFLERLMY